MITKKYLLSGAACILFAALAGCMQQTSQTPQQSVNTIQWEKTPRTILSDFSGAHDPQIYTDVEGQVHVSAVGTGDKQPQLQLFSSSDQGDSFSKQKSLNETGQQLSSHGENSPITAHAQKGPIMIWDQREPNRGGAIMTAASMSQGRSFMKPVKINDAPEGTFAYTAGITAKGPNAVAAWLDMRDGKMALYSAHSSDGGAHWSKNVRIALGVCECCRPSLVTFDDGDVMVVYRNIYEGNIRDMASSLSQDGGKTWSKPQRVAVDNWRIKGCPTSGAHLLLKGERVYAVWYSEGDNTPGIRFSWTNDKGKTWQKPQLISQGIHDATQPSLFQSPAGKAFVLFRGRAQKDNENQWSTLQIFITRINNDGSLGTPQALPGEHTASFPAGAADDAGRLWIVWNDGDNIKMLRGRIQNNSQK